MNKETVALKEFFQRQIDDVKQEVTRLENRVDERLKVYKNSLEYRLMHLNELRDMVNKIMAENVTRKELDLILAPLKNRKSHQEGEREARQEISTKWILILAIAIPTVISLILKFAI